MQTKYTEANNQGLLVESSKQSSIFGLILPISTHEEKLDYPAILQIGNTPYKKDNGHNVLSEDDFLTLLPASHLSFP